MGHDLLAAVARLRSAWDDVVRPSIRRAITAAAALVLFGAAHLARLGVPAARAGAAALLGVTLLALGVGGLVRRRRKDDLGRVVARTIARTEPALGAATLRAANLVDRAVVDPTVGSLELAELHLVRLVSRASLERVAERAGAVAKRLSSAGLALAAIGLAVVLWEPFRVVEGLDVLVAQRGDAPLDLPWLEEVEMTAHPPEYLHLDDEAVLPFAPTHLPRGTVLTVRGRPVHPGRRLVLTDGKAEVACVEDGSGAVVGRFTVGDTGSLRIAARFGDVRVRQVDAQPIVSIPDAAPKVVVEGAPRTVKLLEEPSISIHYEATDDHGLREVDLVLRSAGTEERRVLSKPMADAKVDRGGYELRASDAFFRDHAYTPVEVTVEARDNDTVAGPKWGKSAVVIVVPPEVGEPEALRLAALERARDAVTDLVADRLLAKAPSGKAGAEHVTHEKDAQAKAAAVVNEVLGGSYGGLRVKARWRELARGQLRRLARALDKEIKAPGDGSHQALVAETESALLAIDAGVRGLAWRDARAVAKRLADVAEEAAAACVAARRAEEAEGATLRLDVAVNVLGGGGRQLLRLGDLGRDLGETVAADLRRVARARGANDLVHAELAARDLAARLRKPDPSFSGGGGGGVESGTPSGHGEGGGAEGGGEASGADQAMAEGQKELEKLAEDHSGELEDVSDALDKAASPEERAKMREELRKHAQSIRDAVKGLPRSGEPTAAEGQAKEGRERAESMAGSLEREEVPEAVKAGKEAVQALRDAKRMADEAKSLFGDDPVGRDAAKAAEKLDQELAWAEQALDELRKSAEARAKEQLERSGGREKALGERAQKLVKKGEGGDSSMPEDTLEHLGDAEREMAKAAKSLAEGKGQEGLEHQRKAQRLLEMARGEKREGGEGGQGEAGEGKELAKNAEVPGKDKHKGPEAFRRRVLEGLSGSADPALKDAVRRYAEGLLK
jgi:hypothetical protein